MRAPTEEEIKKIESQWELKCNSCSEPVPLGDIEISIVENEDDEKKARTRTECNSDTGEASAGVAICSDGMKFAFKITKTCDRCHDVLVLGRTTSDVPQADIPDDLLKIFGRSKEQQQ
jgi:hypothetical protein